MTDAELLALSRYARQYSLSWRSRLIGAWQRGTAPKILQPLRETLGPVGLARISTGYLLSVHERYLSGDPPNAKTTTDC